MPLEREGLSVRLAVTRLDGEGAPRSWYVRLEDVAPGLGRVCLTDAEGRPERCEVGPSGVVWSVIEGLVRAAAPLTLVLLALH